MGSDRWIIRSGPDSRRNSLDQEALDDMALSDDELALPDSMATEYASLDATRTWIFRSMGSVRYRVLDQASCSCPELCLDVHLYPLQFWHGYQLARVSSSWSLGLASA